MKTREQWLVVQLAELPGNWVGTRCPRASQLRAAVLTAGQLPR